MENLCLRQLCLRLLGLVAIPLTMWGCASNEQTSSPSADSGFVEQPVTETQKRTTVVNVPRADLNGGIGIHYSPEGPELLTWGPKSFSIDPNDGSFWITDTVKDSIVHVARDSTILSQLDLSREVVGAVSVAVHSDSISVLSTASQPPKVVTFSRSGQFQKALSLPMDWQGAASAVELTNEGEIVVQRHLGFERVRFANSPTGANKQVKVPGIAWNTARVPAAFQSIKAVMPVDSLNKISLQRSLGIWGEITYLYVEEWREDNDGTVIVDATVRKHNAAGLQIGIARIDLDARYTFVDLDGVRFDPFSNQVLAMMTRKDGLDIVALEFVKNLLPLPEKRRRVTHEESVKPHSTGGGDIAPLTCVSWSTMWSNVGNMSSWGFGSSTSDGWSVYTNSSGCGSRTVPRYLTGEYFFGVPYSWGDCDSATAFDSSMWSANSSNAHKAGDADGTHASPTSCSRGVDCSGMITLAWGYSCPSQKLSTSTIPNVSSVDSGSWDPGEVYNLVGSHVVMYYGVYSGSIYYWYESTIDNGYDRVLLTTHPTSYFTGGYVHRRFVNQC